MSIQEKEQLQVTIENEGMEAYLRLPIPDDDNVETYTVEGLQKELEQKGVRYGIKDGILEKIILDKEYGRTILVAVGKPSTDGIDGYYEYHFSSKLDKKPKIRPDGSVDYWSMNLVETVVEGQVIAIYHPAIQGEPGFNVKGLPIVGKRGKELSPLKGKGFERTNDNLTYISSINGKIDLQNDRVMILPIYEVYGNVDLSTGNIDFIGDIVIHGNVSNGVTVKATGSVTIDGVVEAAELIAGKDIVLRSGMLGGNKATVTTKQSLYAKFIEYTTVDVKGNIQADVFLNCDVTCEGIILMDGKRASIIGGKVYAIMGIEANNIGNAAEVNTFVSVGVGSAEQQKLMALQRKIDITQENIDKLERGLKKFEELEEERQVSYKDDPRRMQLLRERIRDTAIVNADRVEAEKLIDVITRSRHASIKVMNTVYPGVVAKLGDMRTTVKVEQKRLEFVERIDHIVMQDLDEKVVI